MKVLLINGSPHENGCTFTALHRIAETLELQDVSTEIFHIGKTPADAWIADIVQRKKFASLMIA